ncbi:hypothetical protein RRG08_050150 [Elysia crispata]|uniref:Uncharacterized protein n=1 Tax=Elysia crispata TaxID=231223 RepID=A0AAE1ACB4_9GAST|nr:hypothetical protein RRG08_050150 [Elysia crispata]
MSDPDSPQPPLPTRMRGDMSKINIRTSRNNGSHYGVDPPDKFFSRQILGFPTEELLSLCTAWPDTPRRLEFINASITPLYFLAEGWKYLIPVAQITADWREKGKPGSEEAVSCRMEMLMFETNWLVSLPAGWGAGWSRDAEGSDPYQASLREIKAAPQRQCLAQASIS